MYRGCAADGSMVREAGWVSRRATVDAVAKTSPFGSEPGVWTSTRPPDAVTAAGHGRGPRVDRHLDLGVALSWPYSPSPLL